MLARSVVGSSRQYLRFTVRGLIVVVVVIGLGVGWAVRRARRQYDAVTEVREAGGTASYNWEFNNEIGNPAGRPWPPQWIVYTVGWDYFGHVTGIILPRGSDAAMAAVGRLTQMQELTASGSSVSDAGLASLAGLTQLTHLNLHGANVTDAGLAHLKDLRKLKWISLRGTLVTDSGLIHLNRLTSLAQLDLTGTRVTDAGIQELKQALPSLRIYHSATASGMQTEVGKSGP